MTTPNLCFLSNKPLNNNELLGDKPFRMLIIGSSGAGKTNLLYNMLLTPNYIDYDNLIIFSKTAYLQKELLFIKRMFDHGVNKEDVLEMMIDADVDEDLEDLTPAVTATNFKKGKKIGEGACGKVYKMNLNSKMFCAMKTIKNIDDDKVKKEAKCFEDDINRYREFINHENIVKYFGAVRNLEKIFIFMEFIDGESLDKKLKKNKYNPLPLTTVKQYTKQILKGLKFLHEQNIIHRDIKSVNILINKNNIVKITDFGTSRFLRAISKHKEKTFCGTANYMSPEVMKNEPYDCSADIWSLGATVFEMATGHPPCYEMRECAVIFKIGTERKIDFPSNMSEDIKGFLNLMNNADPKIRLTADSLLRYEFLN